MKRTLAGVAATTLAVGGMLVAVAAPASAHTPKERPSCDNLEVNLKDYQAADVTVLIDGKAAVDREGNTVADLNFQGGWSGTVDFDGSAAHTWSVDVDAHDGAQWNYDNFGTTTPCEGTTPTPPPEEPEVQVGIYLYPKLDATKDADWTNSGVQTLIASKTLPEDEVKFGSGEYWYTELPSTDLLEGVETCAGWGIQQDLVRGDFDLPDTVSYENGDQWEPQPIEDIHQELTDLGVTLPSGEKCGTPETPDVPEEPEVPAPDEVVVPAAPAAVTVCGASPADIMLPTTEGVSYASTDEGVLAVPTAGNTFGDDLGGYTLTEDGEALFPLEDLVPAAEDCALVPGDIAAVCQGQVPYFGYGVSLPEGIEVDSDTPLTVTFLNPDGENYVATDLPLEGQLLWPGASDTAPLQWPGWELQADGSYTETDGNYAWTRDGVQVLFEVNPSYSTVVDYPPASSQCANPQGVGGPDSDAAPVDTPADDAPAADDSTGAEAGQLAATGATVGWAAGFAALLVAGGVTLFLVRRRLQQR